MNPAAVAAFARLGELERSPGSLSMNRTLDGHIQELIYRPALHRG